MGFLFGLLREKKVEVKKVATAADFDNSPNGKVLTFMSFIPLAVLLLVALLGTPKAEGDNISDSIENVVSDPYAAKLLASIVNEELKNDPNASATSSGSDVVIKMTVAGVESVSKKDLSQIIFLSFYELVPDLKSYGVGLIVVFLDRNGNIYYGERVA